MTGSAEKKAMVIGSGSSAARIAGKLAESGANVVVAVSDKAPESPVFEKSDDTGAVEVLGGTRPVSCDGAIGEFQVTLDRDGETVSHTVESIVIAEASMRVPLFSEYRLTPSERVISLSEAVGLAGDAGSLRTRLPEGANAVFLLGLAGESRPGILEEAMGLCLKLETEFNVRTYVLAGNLKVAGTGLEALYNDTRKAGTVFAKFTGNRPDIRQDGDGGISINFFDEILHEPVRITPDLAIVDERVVPSAALGDLADLFRVDKNPDGFIPSDNVYRSGVSTNRRGILATGVSRGACSASEMHTDAGNAAMASLRVDMPPVGDSPAKAEITWTGRCVGCFTCFRLCPYGAIHRSGRYMTVMEAACEGCGVCAAECPAIAIRIPGLTVDEVSAGLKRETPEATTDDFTPRIVAFACKRGAARAHELARCTGHPLPRGLEIVELPCGGAVSTGHILSAFQNQADGVMVLTCHEGNCHGEIGTRSAMRRVDEVNATMAAFVGGRVAVHTLAANMAVEFSEMVSEFEEKLVSMGPLFKN